MAVHEKREGQYRAAAKLLETMLERGDDPVFAYEALAKLYEHQFRNPEQALHYVASRPSCCWRNRSFIKTRLYKKSKMSYNIVMPVCGASSVRNLPRCDPPF